MGQNVGILDVEEDPLDPVLGTDWIEGASDLVELPLWQCTTQSVVDDLKILLGDFRGLFNPNIS